MVAARAAWRAEAAGIDPARLIFPDESGFGTRLTRTRARAPRGRRALGSAPAGHWERLTLIGAPLAVDGLCAAMTAAAATGTAVFHAFVTRVLVPALRERPGAVVVTDNLAAHKAAVVRAALDRAGVGHRHRHLPAYSPDMNPIEQAWSKLKAHLRRARAGRSREALERAIPAALATITPGDARGWFRHTGYQPN